MSELYSAPWVEAQVASSIAVWKASVAQAAQGGAEYCEKEQVRREHAYDEALLSVEQEVKTAPRTRSERIATQDRITAAFGRFAATALGLEREAVHLLLNDFLPVGIQLARWSKRFDPALDMGDVLQACRNAWTACGLQPLLGEPVAITPSILGYSLLYPYSDNYLDRADIAAADKLHLSQRFRERLGGENPKAQNHREAALWRLVRLIEEQYPRASYPEVYASLLAIHRAQEESIAQLKRDSNWGDNEVLRMSCAKGGTSVLADACLARGWLSAEESRFSFEWGVLLQLGDDLQDTRDDMDRGSVTLFTREVARGKTLDRLVVQLLTFSERVAARMDRLPSGTPVLKALLRTSWRSLIVNAVADSRELFSPGFVAEAERSSPFRFEFLRARRERLTSHQGLYATLFNAFLEGRTSDADTLPPVRLSKRFAAADAR
jgi:hypothetical protein